MIDSEQLIKLFDQWNVPIFKYVFSRIGRREDAEDITQEVFIKAWNHRHSFDPLKSSYKTWIFVIATNTIRDFLRSKRNQLHSELDGTISSNTDIKQETEHALMAQYISTQLRSLKEHDQELIILRYRQDLSIKDISNILNIREGAVKVRLHRALQKLKKRCNLNPF